jgi:flagellar basal body P-ring protein FlgI
MNRRDALTLCGMAILAGCAGPAVRSQSPEDLEEALTAETRLVGDLAIADGMYPITIESVGLVTGLASTGSDPDPSPERSMLISDMQQRGVRHAERLLASPDTALVKVRAVLRPGIQKGDHFDLEVRVPGQSATTSLRNGWLMETRLKEQAVLGGQVRDGQIWGLGEGAVMVDPSANPEEDRVTLGRGRILGGGVCTKSRQLGLVIKPEHQSIRSAAQIENAANRRFHNFNKGTKEGVAKAQTDVYIKLEVHQRYKDNVPRYIQVLRSLPLRENAQEQAARLQLLERQLLDPLVSSSAALKLEAVGREGVPVLKKGISSQDPEISFYSAEALAYLDESAAVAPLQAAARDVAAFRVFALTALSAMDDVAAYDALVELLHVNSAETRYGAFRALWAMNAQDHLVRGEMLGGQFSYHVLESSGPPMVHVTRSYRPEIVLFGSQQELQSPFVVDAGKQIMIKSTEPGSVTISRFSPNEPDQKRFVSTKVDEVIRAIVELGGTYPDVVQALQAAKTSGALPSRFEVDALPAAGRTYYRDPTNPEDETADANKPGVVVSTPLPDLFSRRTTAGEAGKEKAEKSTPAEEKTGDEARRPRPIRSFFARMVGRGEDE